MKIPYRITSGLALGTFVLTIVGGLLAPALKAVVDPSGNDWDPCTAWVQYGAMHSVVAFVRFGIFVVFTAQGLRNRSAPRWLAVVGALSLVLFIEEDSWRFGCYRVMILLFSWMYFGAVGLMFLHHALQTDWKYTSPVIRKCSAARLIYEATLPLFISIFVIWFLVVQVALLIAHHDSRLAETVISTAQRNMRWPAIMIFPFAAVVTLQRIIASEQNPK